MMIAQISHGTLTGIYLRPITVRNNGGLIVARPEVGARDWWLASYWHMWPWGGVATTEDYRMKASNDES